MTERYFIGIDGPAGAGKTATAKAFADKYDFHYVDTGAFYRAFAVWAKMQPACFDAKTSQPLEPEIEVRINAGKIHVSAVLGSPQQIMLYNDKEIPEHMLRTPEISDLSSKLSTMGCVRNLLLYDMRKIIRLGNVIMEGRDVCTNINPDADCKIYLTAQAGVRAMRRYLQTGKLDWDLNQYLAVLNDLQERDHRDMTRSLNPLKPAEGAYCLDNTRRTLDETVTAVAACAIHSHIPLMAFLKP